MDGTLGHPLALKRKAQSLKLAPRVYALPHMTWDLDRIEVALFEHRHFDV